MFIPSVKLQDVFHEKRSDTTAGSLHCNLTLMSVVMATHFFVCVLVVPSVIGHV